MIGGLVLLGGIIAGGMRGKGILSSQPMAPVAIARGVVYECMKVTDGAGGGNVVHLVRIDLRAPGLEIFITPLHEEALEADYEYQLAYGWWVAAREDLTVLVNGTLFETASNRWPWPGKWARGRETVVADGRINHLDPHSYLLWFDDELRPRIEPSKPPPREALEGARWGISGQGVALHEGKINPLAGTIKDRRTVIGFSADRNVLWLAVFDSASETEAAGTFKKLGASSAMLLDGGDSSTLYIRRSPAMRRCGTLIGGWRPVATFLGIRAQPLEKCSPIS